MPDLRDQFLKLNPFTDKENVSEGVERCKFAAVASHNAVPRHSHPIKNLKATITLTPSISDSSFKSANKCNDHDDRYAHHGTGTVLRTATYKTTLNLNSVQINLETQDAS